MSKDQVILSPMGETIGILDTSVNSNMERHNIEDKDDCHKKVKIISQTIRYLRQKDRENKKNANLKK